MRLLLEAGPVALAIDTTSPTTPDTTSPAIEQGPIRTEGPETEMWVVDRRVIESWLRHLAADCDGCTERVPELMIELDLQDADGGRAA